MEPYYVIEAVADVIFKFIGLLYIVKYGV